MKKLIALLCLGILLTQCVPSIHPLYTEKDLVIDDRIIGKWWEGTNEGEYWIFKKAKGTKAYTLELTQENGKAFYFKTHLVKLGQQYYLDFYPDASNQDENGMTSFFPEEFYLGHNFPVHTFAKIQIDDEGFSIQYFSPEWIEKQIRERRLRIKHEVVDGAYILTASTSELQKFILKYGDDHEAFYEDDAKFERIL